MLAEQIRNEISHREQSKNAIEEAINEKIKTVDDMAKDLDFKSILSTVLVKRKESLIKGDCKLSRSYDEVFRSFVRVAGESGLETSKEDYQMQEIFKDILDYLGDNDQSLRGSNFTYKRNYGNRIFTLLDSFVSTKIVDAASGLGFNLEITDGYYIVTL